MPRVPKSTRCTRRTSCGGTARPNRPVATHTPGADPCLFGDFALPDGTPVKPAFQLLEERMRDYTPEWAARITGIPAATIRRLAHEMGVTARDQKIELPIPMDRFVGRRARDRDRQSGRVPRDARARRALQRLPDHPRAGDPDVAAGHDRPARRLSPQGAVPARDSAERQAAQSSPIAVQPNTPLGGLALGWPASPDDLFIDDDGKPVRIDKGFSWEYPLSVHGLMHNVITNAWRGDPYRIDTLHDLHGQHGVELDDEHGRGAQDAERPRRRPASTRSRSSSCATRSSRRRPRSPT